MSAGPEANEVTANRCQVRHQSRQNDGVAKVIKLNVRQFGGGSGRVHCLGQPAHPRPGYEADDTGEKNDLLGLDEEPVANAPEVLTPRAKRLQGAVLGILGHPGIMPELRRKLSMDTSSSRITGSRVERITSGKRCRLNRSMQHHLL